MAVASATPCRRRTKPPLEASTLHTVSCPYCHEAFDLFRAPWCAHQDVEPSKICPSCERCLCWHPAYGEPLFWKEAPTIFQEHGFRRLFLLYL
jgi:hypothetical protein